MRNANCFIVGAPKSGLTALHDFLAQHPDIFMSSVKSPYYFSFDLPHSPGRIANFEAYQQLFAGAEHQRVIGEATGTYLYSTVAARSIHAYNPDAKIIMILRHPVELMYSLYEERRYNLKEDMPTFETALAAEEERRRCPPTDKGALYLYHDVVRYHDQVRRYLDLFGRERVYVATLEEFTQEPLRIYRDILRFLDVDSSFTPVMRIVNPHKRVRSTFFRRLVMSPPPWSVRIAQQVLPASWRKLVVRAADWAGTRYCPKEPMKSETRQALLAEFRDEVAKCSQTLDKDLSCWLQ